MNSFLYLSLLVATANCFYINDGATEKNKIVEGDYDTIDHVPYQIQLIEDGAQVCGGSIISKQWILTASHCVDGSETESLEIITGSTYRGRGGQRHKVKEVIMHENYDSSDFYNDIALIKITKPIQFNPKQKPIRIATEAPKTGDKLFISGFGRVGEGLPESPRLKSATVPVIDHVDCYNSYIGENDVTDDMFCAGVGKADTCQGDSGGPAVFNKKQVGITSFGMDCASDVYSGIYTLLPNYREWITKHTGLKL